MTAMASAFERAGIVSPATRLEQLYREAAKKHANSMLKRKMAFEQAVTDAQDVMLERELCRKYRAAAIDEFMRSMDDTMRDEIAREQAPPPAIRRAPAARAPVAAVAVLHRLDMFQIQGKPLRECTVSEVDEHRKTRGIEDRWLDLLTRNLPPTTVIGERWRDSEAEHLWSEAGKNADV